MGDSDVQAPGFKRNVARAGTQDPFKKDAADLASERAKGEAKREASAPPGGRRVKGVVQTIKDKNAATYNAADEQS